MNSSFTVAALYRFVTLSDFESLRQPILDQMIKMEICGTLLLAIEGINGTIAGSEASMQSFLEYLRSDPRLADLDCKLSQCDEKPFRRSRVRLKREIVTLGVEGIDPQRSVGTYVDPRAWNQLLDDPEVTVIDTRNDYETAIGKFRGAIDPDTETFREFPEFVDQNLDPSKHRKVAMYCTGGIRCEKATALMLQKGFQEVYHLRGGILKYLETIPPEESKWEGDCFVFDERVAVDHTLQPSEHLMCFGCGWPVSIEDRQKSEYVPGVQCPRCADHLTEDQKQRFAMRQQQMSQQQ
jgi:UPF0176 protein